MQVEGRDIKQVLSCAENPSKGAIGWIEMSLGTIANHVILRMFHIASRTPRPSVHFIITTSQLRFELVSYLLLPVVPAGLF